MGILAIVGVVGLSTDMGHVFLNKTRLQNALDAAALQGARTLLLSNDFGAASVTAQHAFERHLEGEWGGVSGESLQVQFSDTLEPFTPGGTTPRFVRTAVSGLVTPMTFSSVLPAIGDSMSIGATAVAGPIPVGYPDAGSVCDLAAILMCGVGGDDDCSDGSCFGYAIGGQTEYQLSLQVPVDPDTQIVQAEESLPDDTPACGPGSVFYNCVPAPQEPSSPGNFMIRALGCSGDACIRQALAGDHDVCQMPGSALPAQSDVEPGAVLDGLMSRSGTAHPALPATRYPADSVLTSRVANPDYWFDAYQHDIAELMVSEAAIVPGALHRRVLAVPFVACSDNAAGQPVNTLLGFGCLYLTRRLETSAFDDYLYAQFVDQCEASGAQGHSPPPLSDHGSGPLQIVLFNDPDSPAS